MEAPTSAPMWAGHVQRGEVREMLRRMLPFVLVAVVLSVVFSVLFATQRMGHTHPWLARFMKHDTDLPVDPATPVEPDKEAQPK